MPRLDRQLRQEVGLPLAWYDILLELQAAPERLRMSELGERVVLSRSRVSRVVDELVAAGLVQREPNPADARSSLTTVTAAGVRRLRAAAPVYVRAIERHFTSHLTAREQDTITRALRRVLTAEAAIPLTPRAG